MSRETYEEIQVEYPESETYQLRLNVGACRLEVSTHDGDPWIVGGYRDPTGNLPLVLEQENGTVRISQEREVWDYLNLMEGIPKLTLQLNKRRAFSLHIGTGASESHLELGGLLLTLLSLDFGAGKVVLDFSERNPERMNLMEVNAGAGALEARNLANSNAALMRIEGGATSFQCDFGGSFEDKMDVKISTGVSSVECSIPAALPAKITSSNVMGSVHIDEGFKREKGAFWTKAVEQGGEPGLNLRAEVALGAFRLKSY